MWESLVLSEREKKILDIVYDKKTVSECESELLKQGFKLNSAYRTIQRLQKRGSMSMRLVNQILGYRRKSKSFFNLLEKQLKFSD